ncbi:hypothetical protein MKX01_034644 [Papaver californicum]|nr:hypothetical protein MKX01_034644 [Papaver californicum]
MTHLREEIFMELQIRTLAWSILTILRKYRSKMSKLFHILRKRKAQENILGLETRIRLLHSKKQMYLWTEVDVYYFKVCCRDMY